MPDIFNAPKANNIYHSGPKQAAPAAPSPEPAEGFDAAKTPAPGMFSGFLNQPAGIVLSNQQSGEQILLFVRRHFATNILWITVSIIALFIPPIFFLFWLTQGIFGFSIPLVFTIILIALYYLIVLGFAFYSFIDWFYNIGIITQKRLIDIDFIHLSYIDVAATTIRELEDASFIQKGFWPSYFDYGNVIARTVAGHEETFVFEKVPRPEKIVDMISKILGE